MPVYRLRGTLARRQIDRLLRVNSSRPFPRSVRGARLQSLVLTSMTHREGGIVPMWRGRSPFDHDRLRQERGRRLRRPLTTTVLVQSAQPPAASRQPPRRARRGHDPSIHAHCQRLRPERRAKLSYA